MKKRIYNVLVMALLASLVTMARTDVTRETEVFSIKGQDTLKLDTYYDTKAEVKPEGRPVIVYVHGGGFTMGSRVNAAQEVFCRYMAERGWLAVSVDYRLAGIRMNEDGTMNNPYNVDGTLTAIRMACEDVVDATSYLLDKKEWRANPQAVTLGGGSAGAMTTLQIVYDTCNEVEYTKKLPQGFAYAGAISQAGAISVPISEEALAWKRNPCPVMLFHGDQDELVPLEQSSLDCRFFGTLYIVRQMQQMGVPYWKWIEKGADHVMAMKPLTAYLEEQYRFLNDFCLKGLQSTVSTEVADKEPASMSSIELMVKNVPLYILGYGKYLDEMDWNNMGMPKDVVY